MMELVDWYQDDDDLQYSQFTPVNPFEVRIMWTNEDKKENPIFLHVVGYGPNTENGAPEMVVMEEAGKLLFITNYIHMMTKFFNSDSPGSPKGHSWDNSGVIIWKD